MTAYTLEEAELWFLSNASGQVRCVKDGEERTVSSYPQAKAFFTQVDSDTVSPEREDDDNIGLGLGTGIAIAESMFDSPSIDTTPDTSSSFDSGGGDFGGGGSSGDY